MGKHEVNSNRTDSGFSQKTKRFIVIKKYKPVQKKLFIIRVSLGKIINTTDLP